MTSTAHVTLTIAAIDKHCSAFYQSCGRAPQSNYATKASRDKCTRSTEEPHAHDNLPGAAIKFMNLRLKFIDFPAPNQSMNALPATYCNKKKMGEKKLGRL